MSQQVCQMFGILAIRLVALAVLYLLWVGQHDNEMTFQDVLNTGTQ